MSNAESVLAALVQMSNDLGRPERDLVILGEGNTSALCDDGTFWVKASGTELRTIDGSGFVRLDVGRVCALADRSELSDAEFKSALDAARVDVGGALAGPDSARRPSVETVLHALALTEGGASFVGHTHPVAVNALMCSVAVPQAISGRLFPDEIVVCGPAPVYVPYTDPGLPLARAVREQVREYIAEWGLPPRVILMQNHGLIALGKSAREVDSITRMYVKTCRVLIGAYACGGPHFMSAENVERIHQRPDEAYRRRALGIA